jgi:hypothetical protein
VESGSQDLQKYNELLSQQVVADLVLQVVG